ANVNMADSVLLPPPGEDAIPEFDNGWINGAAGRDAFLAYVREGVQVNWSDELEGLHEESSRDHFIDVWTRRAMLMRLGDVPDDPVLADIGCSTGHLLEELQATHA